MARLRQDVLLDGNRLFVEFQGALTEQYVLQQLKTIQGIDTYYWSNERNSLEIDFLLDVGNALIPLEVKANINLQSKSLKTYIEKYQPATAVRASMADYKKGEHILDLPLYAISEISAQIICNS